jgi:hypothetical protein
VFFTAALQDWPLIDKSPALHTAKIALWGPKNFTVYVFLLNLHGLAYIITKITGRPHIIVYVDPSALIFLGYLRYLSTCYFLSP